MARRSPTKVGLALALICVITHGQAEETCRTGCRGAPQTFKYKEGTTYKYNFDSKIEVSLSSADGQKSITEVKATVLLTQQPQCNQILRLQNVQIIGNDGKKHSNVPDIDKPISINYHDGHLEDSICITPGDNQNSLNLKRAIASIFQANLNSGHETDVFGLCPTEVTHHKEGNVVVVQKARNLNRCAYRENIKQDFIATAFNLNSEIKSSPILNGDYDANLKIKNGILDQATVHEHYLYVPFSVGTNGAKASIETNLKYVGTAKDNSQVKGGHPRSIIFEDPHPVHSPHTNVNSILQAVKQTAKTIDITVGEHTAKEFTNLVKILRVSKRDDLLAVYNQVRAGVGFPDKIAGKKIFLDALLRAGNGDNIEVVIELLKNKELTPIEQNLVYLGLSTVRHPTENSLNSAAALLDQPHLPRNAYLGVGNLAGRFCRQHRCEHVEGVKKLTQKLVQKLGKQPTNRQDENDLVYVLKALGNFHHLCDEVLEKITSLAQNKKHPNRVRVTALETYLADPCKDKLRDSAISILKDIQQDSEVRIKAYLALAQCPNSKVASAIKAVLEKEPSYQVGGFIQTHIRNVRASANPDKQLAKQHLGQISVPKKYPFDLRKYSANGEFSYSFDTLGIANSIESNIIYSQSSFLPRSTSLNLTAEVFGHTLNFLDIQTRQENLDRLVEHYLGPKGLLRAKSLQELWDGTGPRVRKLTQELDSRLRELLRSRRDLSKAEIESIGKQVDIKTNELNKDLDLDLSVKAFGSEVLFLNLNDDVRKYTPEAVLDQILAGFKQGLDKIKHFDETLRSNLLFLDAELSYPTSSGFPLRLGVEGSANLQLKTAGSFDMKQGHKVKFTLIPSANVEVSGRLTVDTLVLESGLKVISTLHTATGGDLTYELLKNGEDIKFSFPVEKQNILSASHDVVFHNREWGAPEVNTPLKFAQNKDFSICLDQLSPFIGLTFCGEFTGPNLQGQKVPLLPFPFSGDAKLAVTVEKEDLSMYHLRYEYSLEGHETGLKAVLESLGKSGQKKVALTADAFLQPEKYFKLALTSPVTSAVLEGRITLSESERSLSLRFDQDKNEYFGKIGVTVQGSPSKAIYKPIIQYKTPQDSALQVPPYKVDGQVIVEHNGPTTTFTLDNVKLIIPDQKTITFNGKFGHEPETVFADLTVSDGNSNAAFKGKLHVNANLIKYNAELKNSLNPSANIHLKGELAKSPEELKHFFQVAHGGDFSNKNSIFTLENSFKHRNKGPQDFLVDTKNKLSYPGLGANLEFEFQLKPKAVEYDLDVQYGSTKFGSELEYEHNTKSEGTEFKLDFGIWGLNNRVNIKGKRTISGEQSHIENSYEINGKRTEVNGKVRHHIRPQDVDIGADLEIKVPQHNTPFKVLADFKLNPNEIDASNKITSGGTIYIDAFLKANRAGNANGSIKVNLKGQLVVTGQIKANKGSGNGDLEVELPAQGRKSKIDSTFTVHEPNFNIVVNIYPVFDKDKSKKITFSTQTTLKPHQIDSKNFIDFFGKKLEANVKGNQQGDLSNGKINGEAEVTLPNQCYFAGKLDRQLKTVDHVLNGQAIASVEYRPNKNQPGNKFTIKGHLKDTNPTEKIFDVNYQILAESASGKNLNVDLAVKRVPQGDKFFTQIHNKIYGSELSSPIETNFKGTCTGLVGSYEGTSTYAPLGKVAIKGKHDISGSGKPISGDFDIDVSSTSEHLKSLKLGIGGSVHKTDSVDVKGKINFFGENAKGVFAQFDSDGEVKVSDKEARVRGMVKSGKLDPISVSGGISRLENKEMKGDLRIEFGKGQKIKGDYSLIRLQPHEYKLDVKFDTPTEKFKNNRLQVHSKRNDANTHHQSEVILTSDGKTWTANTDLVLSEIAPSVDIKVKCPEGKLRQFLVKITKMSDRQLGGQLKIVNQKENFLLEGTIDANIENIDDFHVKITANAPTLKVDKYVIEAQNKPAKTGRRIQVTAKSGNKNILAGSTSYTAREEHGKAIIEGSGSFKLHDETKSANFKYIRQNLNQAKNGETGIEISFDASLGNKAIDAELKVTDKQFRILNSYCEEKKQCAHVEVDVKTIVSDVKAFNQEIEIAIDLRKLGLSHEFGLKAVTTRKEFVLDHTVDMHFQSQENSKYQYSLYVHPKEAGVSLTTPKRIIALESKVNVPSNILQDGGSVSGEVVFYTDKKNQPNKKSGLISYLNVNTKGQTLDGEIKFTNPALKRPLLISVKSKYVPLSYEAMLTFDIFAQPDQKVVVVHKEKWSDPKDYKKIEANTIVEVKSAGLHLDVHYEEYLVASIEDHHYKGGVKLRYAGPGSKHESAAFYEVTPKDLNTGVKLFNHDLIRLTSKYKLSQNHQVFDSELCCYSYRPLMSHLEVKNLNTLKYSVFCKDTPNDKLLINSGFKPGEIADFRAEIIKGGKSHELGHATVKLDDANFLKSDYKVQAKNIEELLFKPIKEVIQREGDELTKLSSELSQHGQKELQSFSEVAKRATPDIAPLRQYYTSEINKIKEEILADKTIRDLSEFLHNILSVFTQAFGDSFKHFSEFIENIYVSFEKTFGNIIQVIEKEILPKLKVTCDKFLKLFIHAVDVATHAVLTIGVQIADIADKYQPEFQQLANVMGQVSQDILQATINLYGAVKTVIIDQWQQIYNEIQSIPAVEQLKAEYEQYVKHGLPPRENIANTIKDLLSTVKDLAPTEELKAFIQAISDYVCSKINNQQIDDKASIDRIIQSGVASGKSIVAILTGSQPIPELQNFQLPLPATLLNRIPRLTAFRFSPFSFILGEELYVSDFFLSLVNRPRNWIPPFPLYGVVAQGQHIFTFDGKHLTFPGKCNYLLARDALDGNFSVIGSYKDGFLEAISLTQGPDTITLKKHRQVLFNNAPTELPIRKPNIAAYTNEERLVLVSDYGVQVICGPELFVCSVTASGFYHGKLRGLLGNGNNEPYDDFTLPDGKIVQSESEFGNSYKTSSGCPAVQTVSHEGHHANPSCDKLFGWESSLRYCYPFVPVENFKMACEHGLSSGVKDTEFAAAVAYVAACNQHGIPIRVPQQFVKCYNGDKPTMVGHEFTVKTPGKEADIVVLIDTNKENEATFKEYVQPLIQQLTQELSSKGVSDVEFHIIAFGGENHWPSHITTSGGKLTFKGKAPNLKFGENPKDELLKTECPHLDNLLRFIKTVCTDLKLAFGLDLQALTYNEGLEYPFRANAIKSIIAVTSRPCQVGHLYPLQLLRTLLYRGKTINLNLITPIDRSGAKSEAKNIVGFNSRNVYAMGSTKNKIKHFGDLGKELTYNDYCVDFTVQNDGNVFVSDHIHLQPKASRKQFVQLTSHGIVEQLVGVEKSYDCECKFVTPFSAQNVCTLTSSKEKPAKKTGTKS
ncbi:apolipophorins [Tribolium madens]|uniref:apolipophorins n=1 Tax=Tribolium madens TaxID=41895 RepID=UPI001CF71E0D|nr:apolipophorins [Tribolium madens]